MTGANALKTSAAMNKRQRAGACLLGLLLCLAAFPVYSCAPSEEDIVQKNRDTILKHIDIRKGNALNVALEMNNVGIGEIKELEVRLDDEYVKEFTVVDSQGNSYCVVTSGSGYLTSIFKDKLGGEALFTLPPE